MSTPFLPPPPTNTTLVVAEFTTHLEEERREKRRQLPSLIAKDILRLGALVMLLAIGLYIGACVTPALGAYTAKMFEHRAH